MAVPVRCSSGACRQPWSRQICKPYRHCAPGHSRRTGRHRPSARRGTAAQGAEIFAEKCSACHGNHGRGTDAFRHGATGAPALVGNTNFRPIDGGTTTIANFWPYAPPLIRLYPPSHALECTAHLAHSRARGAGHLSEAGLGRAALHSSLRPYKHIIAPNGDRRIITRRICGVDHLRIVVHAPAGRRKALMHSTLLAHLRLPVSATSQYTIGFKPLLLPSVTGSYVGVFGGDPVPRKR